MAKTDVSLVDLQRRKERASHLIQQSQRCLRSAHQQIRAAQELIRQLSQELKRQRYQGE